MQSILMDHAIHSIVIDFGLPLLHRNWKYNARAIIHDQMARSCVLFLATDGIIPEVRFSALNTCLAVVRYCLINGGVATRPVASGGNTG